MNEHDIQQAVRSLPADTVAYKAAVFLLVFMEQVNANSDGWACWKAPVTAAHKMMLVCNSRQATEEHYRQALVPIKSFMTRKGRAAGMQMPIIY